MPSSQLEIPALAFALMEVEDQAAMKAYGAYSLEWLPLAASASKATARLAVSSEADFVVVAVTKFITDNAAPPVFVTNSLQTLDLRIGDKSPFVDREVALENFAGTAADPFIITWPWKWTANTTVVGFLTNLSTAVFNVRLTFHGIHIYNGVERSRRSF